MPQRDLKEADNMMGMRGLATGIGSLPYADNADEALDLILKYVPQIPFWPQLPKRDIREGMVAQFSEKIPCLRISRDGLFFEAKDRDKELEVFYERIIGSDLDHFQISPDFALGLHKFYQRLENIGLDRIEFIKCQITGPFTFAASIKDEKGIALLHDEVFMQAVTKGLLMKALWQLKHFAKFGKKMIVFIDEPYLGCFGSAYTPIDREDVVRGLTELAEGIKAESAALTGVHCCGNTDWSIFTDTKPIDIINFDAYSFLDKFTLYADNLDGFLKKGGVICWGIVPTQEFSGKEKPDSLAGRIRDSIDILAKKGVDRDLLSSNLLITPACGLGALDTQKAEKIFSLLSETSRILQKTK
jgi:methionine synthase II (cobalamin-independent)